MSAKASQNHWDLIAGLPTDGSHIASSRTGRKSGGRSDRESVSETNEAQATTQGRGKKGSGRRATKPVRKVAASVPQSYLLQIEQEERVRTGGTSPSPITASATSEASGPLRSPSLGSLRPPSPMKSPPTPHDEEQEIWIPAVLMDYLDAEWKPVSKKKLPKASNQAAEGGVSGGASVSSGGVAARQTSAPIPIINTSQLDESPKRSNISLTLPPPSPDSRRAQTNPPLSEPLLPPPTPPAKLSPSPRWNADEVLSSVRSQPQSHSFEQLRLATLSHSPSSSPSSPSLPALASPSASSFSSTPVSRPPSVATSPSSLSPSTPAAQPTPTIPITTGLAAIADQASPTPQAGQTTPPSSPSQPRKHPQQPQPPPASSVDIPDDLFCESCQRTFAKSTVYLGHLAGRPHRVAERKRLERLQLGTAEQLPATSMKTVKSFASTATPSAKQQGQQQQQQSASQSQQQQQQQQSPRTNTLSSKSVGRGKSVGSPTALATGTAPLGILPTGGSPPAALSSPGLSPRTSPSILSTSPRTSSSPLVSPRASPTSSPIPPALSPLSSPSSSPTPPRKYQQPQPPPASSVVIPDDLFCESCQRTFAKQTVYLGHLAGRPHRVAERKRLERLEAGAAALTADGKTKLTSGGGKGSQPNSPTTPRSGKRTQATTTESGAPENQAAATSRSPRPRRGSTKKISSGTEAATVSPAAVAATTPCAIPTATIPRQRPPVDLDNGIGVHVDPAAKDAWSSVGSPSLSTSPSVFSSPFGLPSYQFFGSNSILPDFVLPAFPSPRQGLPLPAYPDVSEVLPELDFPFPRAGETRGAAGDSAFQQANNFSSPPSSPGPQRSRFGFALQDDSHVPNSPDPTSIWPLVTNSPYHSLPEEEKIGNKSSPFPTLSSDGLELEDNSTNPSGAATLAMKMRSPRPPPGFSPDPKVPPPGFSQQQKTYVIPARR